MAGNYLDVVRLRVTQSVARERATAEIVAGGQIGLHSSSGDRHLLLLLLLPLCLCGNVKETA